MSRLLKSFPELPFKLLAIGTIADRNASLHFPAPSPHAAFPATANPLVRPTGHPRGPAAATDGWHHGGINE
jgi:hypothetical protein